MLELPRLESACVLRLKGRFSSTSNSFTRFAAFKASLWSPFLAIVSTAECRRPQTITKCSKVNFCSSNAQNSIKLVDSFRIISTIWIISTKLSANRSKLYQVPISLIERLLNHPSRSFWPRSQKWFSVDLESWTTQAYRKSIESQLEFFSLNFGKKTRLPGRCRKFPVEIQTIFCWDSNDALSRPNWHQRHTRASSRPAL